MKKFLLLVSLGFLSFRSLQALEIQGQGKTFPIIEPDILEQVLHEAGKAKWRPTKEQMRKKVETFVPQDSIILPLATKETIREHIPWGVNKEDVINPDGQVIYPKGFRFNPLEFRTLNQDYLLLDLSQESHILWAKSKGYFQNRKVKILSQGGSYLLMAREYGRPIFYMKKLVVEKFGVKAVPSLVKQVGAKLVIKEFHLNEKGEELKRGEL